MKRFLTGKLRLHLLLLVVAFFSAPLTGFLSRTSSPWPLVGEPDIMPEDHMCPECQQGKHQNCDGLAWDFEIDKLTHCDCEEVSHPLRGETEDGGRDDDGGIS
jgi:hypothetical protein